MVHRDEHVYLSSRGEAHGKTLEIGAGNGFSVPHYTDAVADLVLLEPNPHFLPPLRAAAAQATPPTVSIVDGDAHELEFPDRTFDTVTASLVFCSLTDPIRALAEIHRVLKPGGRFRFHEHVRGHGFRALLQDLLTPLQRRLAEGGATRTATSKRCSSTHPWSSTS